MSDSANEVRRTVCKEAFEDLSKPSTGDRVVVGTITSRSYTEFKPTVDAEIPTRVFGITAYSLKKRPMKNSGETNSSYRASEDHADGDFSSLNIRYYFP
jgi:hypothetical protein